MSLLFEDVRRVFASADGEETLEKFNPYHDSKGRFSTAGGAASFTIRTKDPAKQSWAEAGIDREKVRTGFNDMAANMKKKPNESVKAAFTPVKLGQAKELEGQEKDKALQYERGDRISVAGKEYSDGGETGYKEFLKKNGMTGDKDMDEDTKKAYDEAMTSYVRTGNSFTVNNWLRHDQDKEKYAEYLLEEKSHIYHDKDSAMREAERVERHTADTISAMDKIISSDSLKEDSMLTRFTGLGCLKSISSEVSEAVGRDADFSEIVSLINQNTGSIMTEKGFMSASVTKEKNVFNDRDVRLSLLTPQGTPLFITGNQMESEVVLGRNTQMRIIGAQEISGKWGNQIQVVVQVVNGVQKSAIRGPEMHTVESATDKDAIIRQMMGIDDGGEL